MKITRALFVVILCLVPIEAFAVWPSGGGKGKVNFGTTLPSTCSVGDMFYDTDADTTGSLYVCRATDTWKENDDDGAGGGAPSDAQYWTSAADATLSAEVVVNSAASLETAANLGAFFSDYADDANATAMRATLGLVIGTDVLAPDGVGTSLTALNGENIQDDTIDDDSIDFSDVTSSDLTFDADTVPTTAVYSGTTSLEETTGATDSGAYIVGVYDEFDNSNGTNVQDVLDDLDAAIGAGATAYNAIGDPTTVGLITFDDGETATYDGAWDNETAITISLNASDLTGDTTALLITAVDNDDANYIPLLIQDDQDGTPDDLFKVDYAGNVTADGNITAAGIILGSSDNPTDYYNETDGTDWWVGTDDTGNSREWRTNATVGSSVQMELDEDGDLHITGDVYITGDDLFMNTNTDAMLLIADGTNFNPTAVSGDATITNAGVVSVAWGNIAAGELADDSVLFADLDDDGNYGPFTGVWDWTGGTVELPQGANPTTDAAGRIAIDTDDHFIEAYSDASRIMGNALKCETFTISEPDQQADDIVIKHFMADSYPHGVTLKDIAISASASMSDTHVIEEWDDRVGSTQTTVESITLSASQYQEDDGTLSDSAIAADAFLVINLDDSTDDVDYMEITVTYFINPGD